jgi:hypothetical protein
MGRPRKIFLYFLADEYGKSYYVDGYDARGNPNVRTRTLAKFLKKSPKGWQDNAISFGRNTKYFGLNRSFSIPLNFVKDGADIIRHRFYKKKSYEEKLFLIILKWNHLSDTHEDYYKGELDLTEIDDDPATGVTVNLVEGGLGKLIKANENTVYEIPCDGSLPEHILVNMDGILFNDRYNYSLFDLDYQAGGAGSAITLPVTFLNNEGDSAGITHGDQSLDEISNASNPDSDINSYCGSSANYLFSSVGAVEINITGRIKLTPANVDHFVAIFFETSSGTRYSLWALSLVTANSLIDITVNETITLPANEKLFLVTRGNANGIPAICHFLIEETQLAITFNSRNAASQTYAMRPLDVFKWLINKIGDGKYLAESALLEQYSHLVITSTTALRRLAAPDAVIKTTLSDFFQSLDVPLFSALGVTRRTTSPLDEYAFMEGRERVFDSSVVTMSIGEVEGLSVQVAKDELISDLKIGWPNKEYEERAGRLEFNTTAQFKLPVKKVSKGLDVISTYRADSYGAEYERVKNESKDSTDSKADNDTFILNIEDAAQIDGSYNLRRESYSFISGLQSADIAETAYNIEDLTPKRCLLKHGPWLRSLLHFLPAEKITFQTLDKNKDLATTLAGVTVKESADVRVDTLGNPLFYPYIFTFKTKVPVNFIELMTSAINGHIQFEYNGRTFYGFPIEVSVKPALNDVQQWKLLASAANDLSQLANLDPDPVNNLDMATYGLSIPLLSPVQFVPIGNILPAQYHHKHMDSDWYVEQIRRYTTQKNYFQKWQTNDVIALQCFTNGLAPVQADVINCKGRNYGSFPLTQVSTAAVRSPYALFQGSIDISSLGVPEDEIYYVIITAGTGTTIAQFISEGLHIRSDWPGTLLFGFTNDRNKLSTIFTEGFTPTFRMEGMIKDFLPEAVFASYKDEPGDVEILDGTASRKYILSIGEDEPVPPYMIDKLNRIMLLTDVTIDGHGYSRDDDSKFERVQVPGSAASFWAIPIVEATNREAVTLSVDGELQQNLVVLYNIETRLFGDGAGQVSSNIVQIEELDD